MRYCENCHIVTEAQFCPACGSKKLREPREEDFCFLTEEPLSEGEGLAEYLKERQIECVVMPVIESLRSWLALPAQSGRLYVPWRDYKAAKTILREEIATETDLLRERLQQNADKLYLSEWLQRQLHKKKLLPPESDGRGFCLEKIAEAESITDEGRISGCPLRGHYLRCRAGKFVLLIHSETWEVLSVTDRP